MAIITRRADEAKIITYGIITALLEGMRVTEEMIYRLIGANVARNQESVYGLNNKISEGRKVSRASDDPAAFEAIGRSHFEASNIAQYSKNAAQAKTKLLNMDSILQSMVNVFHRASEIAIRAGDSTIENASPLGHEVNNLLESLFFMANSSEAGNYVFAGLKAEAQSYHADYNSDGMIEEITYQGSTEVTQAEVGRQSYVATNIPGTDMDGINAVFQTRTVDLFTSLIQLRDRLLANENTVEPESVTADNTTNSFDTQNVYTTGSRVKISSTEDLPDGLSSDITYFVIKSSDTSIMLADSLENARAGIEVAFNNNGTGQLKITQDILTDLNESLDHVINQLTIVGSRQERIDIHTNIMNQRIDDIQDVLDRTEYLDIADAMLNLSQKQFAYEAALRAASQALNQPSLMDFLR